MTGVQAPPNSPAVSSGARAAVPAIAVFAIAFTIAMAFALYTDHAWEDYFITYRSSRNLAEGHGLVYTHGERVHSFTSPIGVLLPALFAALTGGDSDAAALWLFRILSSGALGTAAVLLLRIARRLRLGAIPSIVLIAMFATDAKTVDFSINGMETAFMMLFLALTLSALFAPGRSPALLLGAAWGALMWTRPDSFVYIGGIALGALLFNAAPSVAGTRRELLGVFVRAGLVAAAIYLPWLLWAGWYYGSPVPHTIIAKGLSSHAGVSIAGLLADVARFPLRALSGGTSLGLTFLPAYAGLGGWHWTVVSFSQLAALICALCWCLPGTRRETRVVSFAFLAGHLYLTYVTPLPFPWYVPSCTLLGIVTLALSIDDAYEALCRRRAASPRTGHDARGPRLLHAAAIIPVAVSAALLVAAAYQLRIQQRVVEIGMRKQIGLWLRAHASSPRDTVFLEPLGYIGYFSQLTMLDTPGLCSPKVVETRRRLGSDAMAAIIGDLRPDWLVLRPGDERAIRNDNPALLDSGYTKAISLDATPVIDSYRWLPGRAYLEFDRKFTVYRRAGAP